MTLDQILDGVQTLVQEAAVALLAGESAQLEHSSRVLRDAAMALTRIVQQQGVRQLTAAQAQRLQSLGEQLSQVREQLARAVALAGQQAACVLPPVESATYGKNQAGEGRIYRAAG